MTTDTHREFGQSVGELLVDLDRPATLTAALLAALHALWAENPETARKTLNEIQGMAARFNHALRLGECLGCE